MNARLKINDREVIIFQPNLPEVNDIIFSLRLLKTGPVRVSAAFLIDKSGQPTGLCGPTSLFFPSRNPYFLNQSETNEFKKLCRITNIQKIRKKKPYLSLAITQFNRAYDDRKTSEDKILDYAIALESLVFHEEKKSIEPAGRVIGIAIGMLLGLNQPERTKIKNGIVKAFEVRNAKVHGNLKKLSKFSNLTEISNQMENYLRLVLQKLIKE